MTGPLVVSGLSKSFGARKAVEGVSMAVAAGEFVALLGPNGAGKTTLFQILTGLFSADAGSVSVFGADMARAPLSALARTGVVFQQPALDLDLSIHANLQFHSDLHGLRRAEGKKRAAYWLSRFALSDRGTDKVRELSGGNRRRVELARALLTNPGLLLMDEATVGIDPASRAQILHDVKSLCREQGMGVLWATHLVDEAEGADRIIVMAKGRILFDGTARALMGNQRQDNLTDAFLRLTAPEDGPAPMLRGAA